MSTELERAAETVRRHALGMPGAYEGFPWDDSVAKVGKKIFAFLGAPEGAALGLGWIAALEAMKGRPDATLLLRQADVRALVVVGELDRVTPIAEAMSLRSLLQGELVVVPNVGQLPNVEDPLAFNDALVAFLAG
jgi:pimeloyl-ACP methyl ester carboxylesterase